MSLILGLWSLTLEPGKTHTQKVHVPIQITNVSFGAEVKGEERSVVTLTYPEFEQSDSDDEDEDDEDEEDEEKSEDSDSSPVKLPQIITKETVLAVLKPDVTEQATINVSLVEDVEVVEIAVSGPNKVYLTGHYIRQEEFDNGYSDDESIDSDEFDSDEDGMNLDDLIAEGSDDESDDDTSRRIQEIKDSDALKENKKSKKRAAEEEAEDVATTLMPKKEKKPAAAGVEAAPSSDAAASGELSKNQKKKLAKKLKAADGSAVAPAAAAPAPAKKADAPKKEGPTPQTLPGGLVIVDHKKGDGPVAKSGRKVGMRYIGKLDNGKVFDSNTKGAPLSFTLGRGEVIKGWDQGIVGMAVGGERKIIIPAALAYGKKGTQGIPGNSTLTFDVKLVTLK